MNHSGVMFLSTVALFFSLTACQTRPVQTETIHDDPSRFVRLEIDSTVGGSHSHPINITTDAMIAVLSGVMIEEQPMFMAPTSLLTKDKESRQHPAFNPEEVRFFAPIMTKGLGKAKSEEVVTFGQTSQMTSSTSKVTSGGVFVDGDELHLILSNYRSETNYAPDPGISGTTLDAHSSPLRSIAPQRTRLYFEPTAALAPSRESILSSLLRPDRREIVVLFKKFASTTSDVGRNPD